MTASKDFIVLMFIVLFGILAYGAISLHHSHAATDTIDTDIATDRKKPSKKITVYRGVASDHPAYEEALLGIARPIGGRSTPSLHQRGFTDSEYTSWSRDPNKAWVFGITHQKGRGPGTLLCYAISLDDPRVVDVRNLPGGDVFKEKEIMIRGVVHGAIPVPISPKIPLQLPKLF